LDFDDLPDFSVALQVLQMPIFRPQPGQTTILTTLLLRRMP
jgi:hypothetical protein